jgi:uncharacterized protein YjbI with pentapeptide repeats
MKASEILNKYTAGERNFQRLNLRGQSFKGQDLAGADFSEADIRSADFTGANLRGANFTAAQCGLEKRWAILLTILVCLLTGISDCLSLVIPLIVSLIFESFSLQNQISGAIGLIVLISFLVLMIRQGIISAALVAAVAGLVTGAAGLMAYAVGLMAYAAGLIAYATGLVAYLAAVAYVAIVAIIVAVVVALAEKEVIGLVGLAIVAIVVTVVVAVVGVYAGALTGVGVYIGWCSWKGDERDIWVRSFALAFAAIGGTNFCSADLSHANFTRVKLKSTDLREANLKGVRWYGAQMLDRVRPGDTYLKNTQVRQWLIGKGNDKNFDSQDLQGINLQGADLTDASFIDTNLSEANLQDVNLFRAKLVRTQLDQTDFTGATLTGACIEDWGITTKTQLDDIKCEYVFIHLPTEKDHEPCRKPDHESEVFKDGEFVDFIKPISHTLDLYHNQGVDSSAIAISWKQLAENNPDAELRLASMEVKGEDNLLLRLKTAPNADLSYLNAEYFETYHQLKALAESEYKKLIVENNDRLQQLENMVKTALKDPDFYAQNYLVLEDNQMSGDRNINLDQGNFNEEIQENSLEGNSHSITENNNQATQQNRTDIDRGEQITKAKVIELLAELEQKILASGLPEETKKKILNRLSTVADDIQEKELDKELVTGNLKRFTETLAQASESTKEANKLWNNVQLILKKLGTWLGVEIQFVIGGM